MSISPTFYKKLLRVQIPKALKNSQVISVFYALGNKIIFWPKNNKSVKILILGPLKVEKVVEETLGNLGSNKSGANAYG